MIRQYFINRKFTAQEVAENIRIARETGLTFNQKAGKTVPVAIEGNVKEFTEYLQTLTGSLRASVAKKQGDEVKIYSFDYQKGNVSEKAINAANAAKLINAALQVGVEQQVIVDFSSALFDEDGYFNTLVFVSQDEKIVQAETLKTTLASVIRECKEWRAKRATDAYNAKVAPKEVKTSGK